MRQRAITVVLLTGLTFGLFSLGTAMTSWRLPDRDQGYVPAQPIAYSHRLHAGELGIDCRFCHWAADYSRYAGIPSTDICMKCHKVVTTTWDQVLAQAETSAENGETPAEAEKGEAKEGRESAPNGPEGKSEVTVAAAPVVSPKENKLLPLYQSLGLDASAQPIDGAKPQPIAWVRVHNLPDYVYFDHSAHMAVGLTCQKCHGAVESMERVRQFASLSMGWCVSCHRESTKDGVNGRAVNAPTNCAACHY